MKKVIEFLTMAGGFVRLLQLVLEGLGVERDGDPLEVVAID